ncbi:DUF4291 family protein [Nocardiopsis aegyptia]|uniref:Uncharacterized protein n=1 Tax=Nocardiopsis aegyptia TaxID=220378 RepID=A0A7Z0J8W9_9ACTN|nr:DUF4291 family protein [Nocardiopsis aegyptia]NYJ32745.1 hypothetical protein [Nocardiopsis aegyptia]
MPSRYQVRAEHDADTIVVYQAYSPAIAEPALRGAVSCRPSPSTG